MIRHALVHLIKKAKSWQLEISKRRDHNRKTENFSNEKHDMLVWDHITFSWAYKHTQGHVKHQNEALYKLFLEDLHSIRYF